MVQYTTNTQYKFKAPSASTAAKILFSAYISDPQPKLPVGFNTHKGISLGDYVLVHSENVTTFSSPASRTYKFNAADGYIMDSDWNNFDEDTNVTSLIGENESFLVYREMIVVTKAQAGVANEDPVSPAKTKKAGKKTRK